MLLRVSVFLSLLLALIFTACSPEHSEIVLAKFDDHEIKMNEFEQAYAKNAGGLEEAKDDSLSQYEKFLNLYVNFQMKLRDAEVRDLKDDPSIENELNDYKKKVGASYIIEKSIVEPAIQKLYDHRKFELRVSHIMLRHSTTNDDSVKQLAKAILDSIKNGSGFEDMVARYSEDSFSKPEGGDIYYVTAGQLPVPFEDAAYATKVGEVYPKVVKTNFGYHIIKVTDRRDRIPKIKASHILIGTKDKDGNIDTVTALAKIDTVLTKLKNGEDFAELAKQYSEDPGSKEKGGDLGFFQRRMMVKPFDEAAFNLDVGEVSGVVKTQYGYHIIKVTEKEKIPKFDFEKDNLKKLYKQTRYEADYDAYVDSLKKKYNYSENQDAIDFLRDSSFVYKIGEEFPDTAKIDSMLLFSFDGTSFSVGDYLNKLAAEKEYTGKYINPTMVLTGLKKVSSDALLEYQASMLEKTDPKFADLMKDYKNGLLIFKLQEDEVWNKIKTDSTRLYEFWQATKENYVKPDRVNFSEIFSKSDSLIHHYFDLLKQGENFDTLASKFTERQNFKVNAGNFGWQDADKTIYSKKAAELEKPGDFSEPFTSTGGFSIVKLNERETSRLKTFEEARPEVSAAYQEAESKRLENEYLQKLKDRYHPELYYENLQTVYKSE